MSRHLILDNPSRKTQLTQVTPEQTLADIRGYAGANRVTLTGHVRLRMAERGAKRADVLHALQTARACKAQESTWLVRSSDSVGDEMTLVVAIEDGLVVVTLWE